MDIKNHIQISRVLYCKAIRFWRSNNISSSLAICHELTKKLNELALDEKFRQQYEVVQLKQLVWFLKIRCLVDDYFINESLLLNEEDFDNEDQVRILNGTRQSDQAFSTNTTSKGDSIKNRTSYGKIEARPRTGVITGRMPSASSRQSSRATSSYRPLTTSLTASQTAFSKSTRPLLKYSTHPFLSRVLFEYLYNAQAVNNKCPDYRQCLEYLNLVKVTFRKKKEYLGTRRTNELSGSEVNEPKSLGVFWLVSLGTCYFKLRMLKQAEDHFLQAVSINPKYLDSYAWLVKIYIRTNQLTKVLKTCEKGLFYSKSPILFNWMARIQSLMGEFHVANANLRQLLKYCPTNLEALANVGYFAFYGDKLEQSLKCFERIQQLSVNQTSSVCSDLDANGCSSQLLNNLALCNYYCGFYHKVMPLFLKSILYSQNKEVISDIWYNISFIPLGCGFTNLAIACLRLSLRNNSQNAEALNNLGVLKYRDYINDELHYENKQELWGVSQRKPVKDEDLMNLDEHEASVYRAKFREAETYFSSNAKNPQDNQNPPVESYDQPEMLYNMALLKKRQGQLLSSVGYCNLYLEQDPNNHHIRSILREINQLIYHDD